MIDPMEATDFEIAAHCYNEPWALDDDGKLLPPWVLRHLKITDMLGLHDDNKPIAWNKKPDARINAYSTVITDGPHVHFSFKMRPKYIKGRMPDSQVKAGAFVQLSFAWQAYTRDQPNQQLLPLHRSIA